MDACVPVHVVLLLQPEIPENMMFYMAKKMEPICGFN
jgi:hypothetical protein